MTQRPIIPGGQAPIAFAAPSLLMTAMPVGGQVELVGPLNWLIRSAGLVSWDDLFDGNGDPRDFDAVVRRKGLTLEQLRRAGVAEGVARRANRTATARGFFLRLDRAGSGRDGVVAGGVARHTDYKARESRPMAAESSDGLGGRPGERWRNLTSEG